MLNDSEKRIQDLEAQVSAVASMAEAVSGPEKQLLLDAAKTIQGARYAVGKKLEAAQEPIQVLDPNATEGELMYARIYRAVQRGDDTYLPSWKIDEVAMPNALLRSSLFASSSEAARVTASTADSESTRDAELARLPPVPRNIKIFCPSDTSITLHGVPMHSYDRQVYAACLNHYRLDRPLNVWCTKSYYQLAHETGRKQGVDVYRAIRASLRRLNIAVVGARLRRGETSIAPRRLLEVNDFDGAPGHGAEHEPLRGSDIVEFRVPTDVAQFYGPNMWTKVPQEVFKYRAGLRPWIAAFYSTHGGPWGLAVESLHKMSGMGCSLREFERLLISALSDLESDTTPDNLRVVHFITDGNKIAVYLERWCGDLKSVREAVEARKTREQSLTPGVVSTSQIPHGASIFAALRSKLKPE